MTRSDVVQRYGIIRQAAEELQRSAFAQVAAPTYFDLARQIGIAQGRTIAAESEEELALLMDLAVHTAKPGRSRAIDRLARTASLEAGSEAAAVVAALQAARFSVWRTERAHAVAGVVLSDVYQEDEVWLMDMGLEQSAKPGFVFASRLLQPAEFAIGCGVLVPIDAGLLLDTLDRIAGRLNGASAGQTVGDPRFAAALYGAAIELGVMRRVTLRAPALAA